MERITGPHAEEAFHLDRCAIHLPRLQESIGLEPMQLYFDHIAFKRWRTPLFDASAQQLGLPSQRRHKVVAHRQVANSGGQLSVFHANIDDERSLAVRDTLLHGLQFLFCHLDATGLAKQVQRPLNLDPGYLTSAKQVLSSTKDHTHRIYLGEGIFGEITLFYRHGAWRDHEFTFPNYRRADYQQYFTECRNWLQRGL